MRRVVEQGEVLPRHRPGGDEQVHHLDGREPHAAQQLSASWSYSASCCWWSDQPRPGDAAAPAVWPGLAEDRVRRTGFRCSRASPDGRGRIINCGDVSPSWQREPSRDGERARPALEVVSRGTFRGGGDGSRVADVFGWRATRGVDRMIVLDRVPAG